jgi:uncharacterized membrane protein YgcG
MSCCRIRKIIGQYGAILLAAALSITNACADERILDYHSDITINADGSLTVAETIRVVAEGANIRRGIYRDFPTDYQDRRGNRYRTGFQVIGVRRNGEREAFHTEKRANGVRVYMGSASSTVPHGEHEYSLLYRTTRQLGFFDEFDELYWNVTGNGWMFPIDRASATVELPAPLGRSDLRSAMYTGFQGQNGSDAEFRMIDPSHVSFSTTRGLKPREGLTVSLGWPKGMVHEPDMAERIVFFLKDNGAGIVFLFGILLPLSWYLWSWNQYGRDPEKGVIIPRFMPPEGLSAAACRYVRDMGPGSQAFTAAIISLGVKGYLKIGENDDDFVLSRTKRSSGETATKGEQLVLEALLPHQSSSIELDNENYQDFQRARNGLGKALKAEYRGRLFKLNSIFMAPAVIMSIIAVIVALTQHGGPGLWIAFVVLSLFLHGLFLFLLRAPTPAGRQIMDEIEGFEMYLDTAEQDRLDRMRSPELSPEVFEKFLPYAFALGVQNHWCERFAREFPREVADGGHYRLGWYNGEHTGLNGLRHIGDNFSSSFSSAISSASSPPGSSSGSGGGGFSGGGGGGGGGGGW